MITLFADTLQKLFKLWSFKLLAGPMILTLLACQPNKEVVTIQPSGNPSGDKSTPTPPPSPPNQGTSTSGGGGNAICTGDKSEQCYTIEGFVFNLYQTPAYKEVLAPIMENLKSSFPQLISDFLHIAGNRLWYHIPVALDKLPQSQIGTYFGTEQFAMQGLGEIFFDYGIIKRMELKQQGLAYLHELVMGVRLMEFQSDQDQCLARISILRLDENRLKEEYPKQWRQCLELSKDPNPLKKLMLRDSDYWNVRKLTDSIFKSNGVLDQEEWKTWMKSQGFRNY